MSDISGIWRLINNEKNKFFLNTILFLWLLVDYYLQYMDCIMFGYHIICFIVLIFVIMWLII